MPFAASVSTRGSLGTGKSLLFVRPLPTMYNQSLVLIMALEAFLLGERLSDWPPVNYLQRLIWFPLKFLKMGIAEKTKSMSLWPINAFIFMFVGAWVVNNPGIVRTETANVVLLAPMIIPVFLIVFALPSFYGHSGVTDDDVKFVEQHLLNSGFKNPKEVELLKKSVKPIEDRSRNRVTALKWIVGLLWAGLLYVFSKNLEPSQATPAALVSYAYTTVGLLIAVFAAYLVVWGYEASLDRLFRAIEFGCNDFCYAVEAASTTEV
jgi:hypothetical protein